MFTPAIEEAGIQDICWHTLRHTFASRLVMVGLDLYTVKEIPGHRDIQTTMRYAHLSPAHLKEAVNKVSLFSTVTKTVTEENLKPKKNQKDESQAIEKIVENNWLGDQGSNLGSQIQNLASYR